MRKSTILVCPEVNPDTWANLTSDELQFASFLFDRGYTGHEMLRPFGLINMNGRVYDPLTSRFLSPDNFVQDPANPQNYNRYAYVLNNPLKYTDPSGEWINFVIGAIVGGIEGYMIGKTAGLSGWNLFWSTLAGAGIGAATAGIGTAISTSVGGASGVILASTTSGAVGTASFNALSAVANKGSIGDVTEAFMTGIPEGIALGFVGGTIGGAIGGGWGVFAGGAAVGGLGVAMNGDSGEDILEGAVIGGAIGWGLYHTSLFYSYEAADIRGTLGLNYNQYAKMIAITQRSMFWGRERFMTIDNTGKITTGLGNENDTRHEISKNTIFDYHTHQSPRYTLDGGDGFSYGFNSDQTTRMQTIHWGFNNDMYVGTWEGHIHYWTSNNVQGAYIYNFSNLFHPFNLAWSLCLTKFK